MQLMSDLIQSSPKGNLEELHKEILDDKDIKRFINNNAEKLSVELIERSMTMFREFILNKQNKHRRPELVVESGAIYIRYYHSTDLEARYRDKVIAGVTYDNATLKYKGVSLSDYEESPENKNFINFAKNFVETYKYKGGAKGLWIYGKFGVGKTYLMAGLARDLYQRHGANVSFVSMSQLMDDIYSAMNFDKRNIQAEIERLSKAEVLIIDDIGTENPTNYMLKNVLYPIIKYRGEYNRPTFITSNLSKDDYYIQLNSGKEIIRMDIARLKEQLDVLTIELAMTGNNRRNKA